VIKGKGKGPTHRRAGRRKAVVDTSGVPPLRWIAVEDLFRFLRASGHDFALTRNEWDLYIAEHYYGSFGEGRAHSWELLQGRFILAFLFEYAATLGLLDVATSRRRRRATTITTTGAPTTCRA
jgi:hypothetical protein